MAGTVQLAGVRALHRPPSPHAPIKSFPRAPPSSHQLRPFLSSLVRAQFVERPLPSSSSPMSRPSLLPAPLLVRQAIAWPPSFATPPRTQYTTPPPRLLAQSSPTATPPRSSATSPRAAPSRPPLTKLSPPLGPPSPPRAKTPAHCPRTGPPAANRRRAHRRPVLPRGRPVHPPVNRNAVPSLPPSHWQAGPAQRRHPLPRPRRSPRSWAAAGPKAPQRARSRPGWAKIYAPGPDKGKSLLLFLFHPFFHLISILQYFMHQKLSK